MLVSSCLPPPFPLQPEGGSSSATLKEVSLFEILGDVAGYRTSYGTETCPGVLPSPHPFLANQPLPVIENDSRSTFLAGEAGCNLG